MTQQLHDTTFRGFASDNYSGVHPEILAAISAANDGHQVAYGEDVYTERLQEVFVQHFGKGIEAFPVFNGTGANVTALQSMLPRWGAVISAKTAHINSDEGGAPERVGGIKLLTVEAPDGKLTPELIDREAWGWGDEHRAQPLVVSITQTTELGTAYTADEIRAIADHVHERGMKLHLDGARIGNAGASLGVPLRAFTRDAGVDLLSVGGTKNGCLGVEHHDRLAEHRPVLGAAEAQHVDAGVAGEGPQRQVERGGGVRDARAVHVQSHAVAMDVVGDLAQLVDRVPRAELGGLRQRDHERLGAVLVAPAPRLAVDQLRRQLAVVCRHREQLDPGHPLRCACLIHVDVGGGCRDHGAPAREHRLEPDHVRPGAVEHREGLHAFAEVLDEDLLQASGVVVLAVGDLMTGIGLGDGFEHLRVDAGIVVGGEAADVRVVQGGHGHPAYGRGIPRKADVRQRTAHRASVMQSGEGARDG